MKRTITNNLERKKRTSDFQVLSVFEYHNKFVHLQQDIQDKVLCVVVVVEKIQKEIKVGKRRSGYNILVLHVNI